MCGIVGSTIEKVTRNVLNLMSDRGPDQRGLYDDDTISLGHTRLSIMDVNGERSRQPLVKNKKIMVFNGEIYNYDEISQIHLNRNNESSDTHVLFDCLEKFGIEKTLSLLNGMFSFCFYDSKERILWFARDRLGKKPLFYLSDERGITFSSSIQAIKRVHNNECFKINQDIIGFYFSAFYIPSPYTIYKDIMSLPAGHYAKYDLGKKKLELFEYWQPNTTSRNRNVKEFSGIFKDAVNIRLRSDVPLGAFLSGGIDSTIVVGHVSDVLKTCSTYTAGIEDTLNEETYAAIVSKKYNTNHVVKKVKKNSLTIRDIRRLNRTFEQPFADSSIVPTEAVCDKIADDVTVAISGDGADEIFMGYDKYFSNSPLQNKLFRNVDLNFIKSSIDPMDVVKQKIPNFDDLNEIEKINQFDIRIFLEGDILQKIDRISMSKSLEVRSPFLDYRIVELALGLPLNDLMFNGTGKYFLKRRVEKNFGSEFAFRKKTGFMLSMNEWRAQLNSLIRPLEYVFKDSGFFKEEYDLTTLNSYTLFSMIVFLAWLEEAS